jgi:hypothetical protein
MSDALLRLLREAAAPISNEFAAGGWGAQVRGAPARATSAGAGASP